MSNGPVIEGKTVVDGKTMRYGECKFCHQMYSFETLDIPVTTESVESLDRRATEICSCDDAKAWRLREKKRDTAMENIEHMFRRDFPETADILSVSVDAIMLSKIDKISLDTGYGVKAEMLLDKDGNVVLNRTETVKKTLKN